MDLKRLYITNAILQKKSKNESITLPDFKLHYKATAVLYNTGTKTDIHQLNKIESPETNMLKQSNALWHRTQEYTIWKKREALISDAEKTKQVWVKE